MLFLWQVQTQCDFFFRATEQINVAMGTLSKAIGGENASADTIGLFAGIQASLTAAANISKALWGQAGKRSDERKILRDRIGVLDDSPLRPSKMRDHFDHYDERLQRWWDLGQEPHHYIDMSIVTPGAIKFDPPIQPEDKFRVLEPLSMTMTFWGDEVPLREVYAEISRIYPKVIEQSHLAAASARLQAMAIGKPPDAAKAE